MTTLQKNWRDLIRPRSLVADSDSLSASYGKFTAEPLERGFANTLGNSLRRVLLSSLQGTAITGVKIEGVLHEFTTVPEVHEDVVDIVLNLKHVVLRSEGEGPYSLKVKVKGEATVTAGDIDCPTGVEVINKDQVIAHVGKGGVLEMTLTANTGRGFVTAEGNKSPDQPIGEISIDSSFSPVKKVNYQVGQARVGQMTNYDKLTLEIWTNGTVSPDDALGIAARVIQDQLAIFVAFDADALEEPAAAIESGFSDVDQQFLKNVEALELSQRSINALQGASIETLGQLVQMTETELKNTKNFGAKSLEEVKAMLREMDLTLGMKIPGWDEVA